MAVIKQKFVVCSSSLHKIRHRLASTKIFCLHNLLKKNRDCTTLHNLIYMYKKTSDLNTSHIQGSNISLSTICSDFRITCLPVTAHMTGSHHNGLWWDAIAISFMNQPYSAIFYSHSKIRQSRHSQSAQYVLFTMHKIQLQNWSLELPNSRVTDYADLERHALQRSGHSLCFENFGVV